MLPIQPDPEDPDNEDIRWDDLDGDIGSDGTRLFVACTYDGAEEGICVFTPNPGNGTITYNGKLADPLTTPLFTPGPRLGGLDIAGGGLLTSDMNGPTVQLWEGWDVGDPEMVGTVKAFELPRHEFVVERLTVR